MQPLLSSSLAHQRMNLLCTEDGKGIKACLMGNNNVAWYAESLCGYPYLFNSRPTFCPQHNKHAQHSP